MNELINEHNVFPA